MVDDPAYGVATLHDGLTPTPLVSPAPWSSAEKYRGAPL